MRALKAKGRAVACGATLWALGACSAGEEAARQCALLESQPFAEEGVYAAALAVDGAGRVYAGHPGGFGVRSPDGSWAFEEEPFDGRYASSVKLTAVPGGEVAAVLNDGGALLLAREAGQWKKLHYWEGAA